MGLLINQRAKIAQEYIRVWDVINKLYTLADNNWSEVAQFMGHHDFDTQLKLYRVDNYLKVHSVDFDFDFDFQPIRNLIASLSALWLSEDEAAEINHIKFEMFNYYWLQFDLAIFQPIIDLGIIEKTEIQTIDTTQKQEDSYDYKFYLFKKPLLTFHEASCIMTGYNPQYVEQCQNDTNFKQNFSNYLGAKDYIDTCTDTNKLGYDNCYRLDADEFKHFLANDDTFIDGFNDHLKNMEIDQSFDNQNLLIDQLTEENEELKKLQKNDADKYIELAIDLKATENTLDKALIENENLKAELQKKDERIKELELIQTSQNESKLGNTRAENNVAKLILALSAQANIDTSKPYAQYESLKTQAELLGIDKFPSDENVASWLKKANFQNPN